MDGLWTLLHSLTATPAHKLFAPQSAEEAAQRKPSPGLAPMPRRSHLNHAPVCPHNWFFCMLVLTGLPKHGQLAQDGCVLKRDLSSDLCSIC